MEGNPHTFPAKLSVFSAAESPSESGSLATPNAAPSAWRVVAFTSCTIVFSARKALPSALLRASSGEGGRRRGKGRFMFVLCERFLWSSYLACNRFKEMKECFEQFSGSGEYSSMSIERADSETRSQNGGSGML